MAQPKQARAKHARPAKTPAPHRTGAGGVDASKAVRGGIAQPVSRAEVTKRVWAYIKAHDLQDAQDRRQIHADATLKKVLGRDQVSMFEMTKLLNQHVK